MEQLHLTEDMALDRKVWRMPIRVVVGKSALSTLQFLVRGVLVIFMILNR